MYIVRPMMHHEIEIVVNIYKISFPNDCLSINESISWIRCKFNSWPVNKYYIAQKDNIIVGYILWVELGGFRKNCVLELEQIAIADKHRGKGMGTNLIDASLEYIFTDLKSTNRLLKLIEITTSTQNKAQRLYKKSLNATAEAVKSDFFDEDELIMISRLSELNRSRKNRGLTIFKG